MSERLFLLFQETEAEQVLWFYLFDDQIKEQGSKAVSSLAELNVQFPSVTTIAFVPSSDCLVTEVVIPTKQRRQQLKAIPFAVEEQLAADVEDMHFAIGKRQDNSPLPVIAIDKNKLRQYLQILTDTGISISAALPLSSLLEAPLDAWSIFQLDDLFIVNQKGNCWIAEAEEAALMLQLSLLKMEDTEQPALLFWGNDETPSWISGLGLEFSKQKVLAPWQALLLRYNQQSINLLQGSFEVQDDWHAGWKIWRNTAIFAFLVVLMKFSMMGFDLYRLNGEKQFLKDEIARIYHQVSPGARITAYPERQMRQLLTQKQGSGESSGSFLVMAGQLAESLSAIPDVRPTNLSYDSKKSEIRLDLLVSKLPVFDQLKEQLVAKGLSVEVGGASAQGDEYSGRLVIKSIKSIKSIRSDS